MADMLADASNWLHGQRKTHLATTVVLRRGNKSVSVSATRGRTEFEVETSPDLGTIGRIESRDYLIDAVDYDFGSGAVLPLRGDKIDETDADGRKFVYEVLPFGMADGTHWRYSDPYRQTLRVHTKHVDTVEP